MTYEIKWKPQALSFLQRLPRDIALRIHNRIGKLRNNPFHFLEHYEGESTVHKLRIGDYRALITVDLRQRIVVIEVLDKRSRIYK